METPNSVRERARDYWEIDGIPSVAYGLVWLGIVIPIILLLAFIPLIPAIHSEFLKGLAGLAIVSWPLLTVFLLIWLSLNLNDLIEKVKLRITYPRSGYVAPPSEWNDPRSTRMPTWAAATKVALRIFWICLFFKFWGANKPEAGIFLLLGLSSGSISSIQDHFEKKSFASPLVMFKGIGYWLLIYLALVFRQSGPLRIAIVVTAIVAMAVALINGKFSRHVVLPVIFVSASIGLIFLDHNVAGAVLLVLTPGLILVIDGLLTFSLYLRANPLRSA